MKNLLTFLICICFSVSGYSQITEAEYYIDTDMLGVGNQNALTVTTGNTIDENFTIPTTGLAEGLHTLHIRAKGTNTIWSLYKRAYFYVKAPNTNGTTQNIVAAEYYIDTDGLGVGNQTALTITSGMAIDESFTIPTTDLADGLHVLHIRVKDADDTWSLYKRAYFYTQSPNSITTATPIIAAEYFFDTDPGVGTATSVAVTQGFNIDEDLVIQVPNAMVDGDHYLYLRVQDQDGTWSLYKRALFTVDVLSVEEFNSNSFKIYPNPTDGIITIETNLQIQKIEVFSILGRKIRAFKNTTTLDLANEAAGIYLLKMTIDGQVINKKIVLH